MPKMKAISSSIKMHKIINNTKELASKTSLSGKVEIK